MTEKMNEYYLFMKRTVTDIQQNAGQKIVLIEVKFLYVKYGMTAK